MKRRTKFLSDSCDTSRLFNASQRSENDGAFIKVEEVTFRKILNENKALLVVQSKSGIFSQSHLYLTSHKGFVIYTKSKQPISIPEVHEVIQATQVMLPNL